MVLPLCVVVNVAGAVRVASTNCEVHVAVYFASAAPGSWSTGSDTSSPDNSSFEGLSETASVL